MGSIQRRFGWWWAARLKHDPKARRVTTIDDFAYIKDRVSLLAVQDVGEIDKSQRTILGQGLELRNACGHPSKYRVGIKKVSSFIEDTVGIRDLRWSKATR